MDTFKRCRGIVFRCALLPGGLAALALLAACTRSKHGVLLPESLPYSLQRLAPLTDIHVAGYSLTRGYDSLKRCSIVEYVARNGDQRTKDQRGMRATGYPHYGLTENYFDQVNFTWEAYPGLDGVMAAPWIVGYDTARFRDVFHLYFHDSIVVGVHAWYPDRWLHRVTIPRFHSMYLMPLTMWRPPAPAHWLYAFRITNRSASNYIAPDTLCILDIETGIFLARRPVGANYGLSINNAGFQQDSLLILVASAPKNNKSFAGFDDRHCYVVAHRLNGDIAWADTLTGHPYTPDTRLFEDKMIFNQPNPSPPDQGNTTVTVRHAANRDTLSRRIIPLRFTADVAVIRHPNGQLNCYYTDDNGRLWKFDSTFSTNSALREPIPFTRGIPQGSATVQDEMTSSFSGEHTLDINGDSVNDILMSSVDGQVIAIDGARLTPVAASGTFDHLAHFDLVRNRDGTAGVLLMNDTVPGMVIERFSAYPTPLLTRIMAWWDVIILSLVFIALLPLAFYAVRRIHYLRALFLRFTKRNALQGSALIAGNGKIVAVNNAARGMLGVADTTHAPRLQNLPPEFRAMIAGCLQSGTEETRDLTLVTGSAVRYLSANVAPMRAIGSKRGCLLTLTESTSQVESELQRRVLWETRESAHKAKNRLPKLQVDFRILMKLLHTQYGSLSADIEKTADDIYEGITESSDQALRIMYLSNIADFTPHPEKLSAHVERWLRSKRRAYERQGIALHSAVPEDLPPVRSDYSHLAAAFECICDNAVDAMKTSAVKQIRFDGKMEKDALLLTIADTGAGMDAGTLERVRTQAYFTTKEQGTGFGMKIVRKVCDEHNATLQINSTEAHGTVVEIRFVV